MKKNFQELFGDSTGPEESFFKFLKPRKWNSLDLSEISLPTIPPSYKAEVSDLLSFINTCLEPDSSHLIPKDDYKEFLELAKMILGGEVERKRGYEYHIQRPGADHHARWMSKAIYALKVTLLLPQFPSFPWYRKNSWKRCPSLLYSSTSSPGSLLPSFTVLLLPIWHSLNG